MKTLRQVVSGVFASLLLLFAGQGFAQADRSAPRVDGFDVEQVERLAPGAQLNFSVFGSPGATAILRIDGARDPLVLPEVQPGVYEGSYTIAPQDRIAPDSRVTAELAIYDRVARSVLTEPLLLAGADVGRDRGDRGEGRRDGLPVPPVVPPDTGRRASPVPAYPGYPYLAPPEPLMAAAPVCSNCGVVEAIQRSQAAGGNSNGYVGAVAGGIIGAIFGNEVGHREGRKFARVLGAIGGALVGREIERAGTQHFRYDVIVRLESGSRQSIAFDAPPPLRVGDKVRLAEGRVQRVG